MSMKVAWLIQNLVPYHHARFEAFAQNRGVEAHLVQVTDKDDFCVLEYKPEVQSYRLHTMFEGRDRATIDPEEIRNELDGTLGAIHPDCVCVSGWGMEIGHQMHFWALEHQVPIVMFSESTAYDQPRVFWKEWIKSVLVRSASSALVGGAPHRAYVERLGMPADAVFDGHNVVDISHFAMPTNELPAEFPESLLAEHFFFVCTRFGEKKNLPRLIRAYSRHAQKCRSEQRDVFKLVIAGDGPLRDEIDREIEVAQLSDQIIMLGSVDYDELPWLYQHCAAFVHVSTTEQWGLVANEAMAAGAPLLLGRRCGCALDLLEEGGNGFGFDPLSVEDIAETLFRCSTLPAEQRETFSERSRAIISDWGPARFSCNLMLAAEHALAVGIRKDVWVARRLLGQLMKKGRID